MSTINNYQLNNNNSTPFNSACLAGCHSLTIGALPIKMNKFMGETNNIFSMRETSSRIFDVTIWNLKRQNEKPNLFIKNENSHFC